MGGKFEQVVNGNASEDNSALKFSHLRLSGGLRFNLVLGPKIFEVLRDGRLPQSWIRLKLFGFQP